MHKSPQTDLVYDGSVYALRSIVARHRPWFFRQALFYSMHDAVIDAFKLARPKDWHAVVLEYPHGSTEDKHKLAYTRSEQDGERDRTTRTSIGKYLTRHWGGRISDQDICKIAARYTGVGFEFREGTEAMIEAVQRGPVSCMQFSASRVEDLGQHPYAVYAPSLGWKIAVRVMDGAITSRCLCCDDEQGKRFVRTYKSVPGAYSQRDTEMEEWLKREGYEHAHSWEGSYVSLIHTNDDAILMPYIDGAVDTGEVDGDVIRITDGGELDCSDTGGTASEECRTRECECCGCDADSESGIHVGRRADTWVGSCCADDYTLAYGRRGAEYYVHNDNTVAVDGEYYDADYLSGNSIVELHDGEYCHLDNASMCAVTGDYYLTDECVYAEDLEDMVNQDDAWQCGSSNEWYSNDVDPVEVSGVQYHPDNAPEEDDVELSECREVIVVSEPVCVAAMPMTVRERKDKHFSDIRGWNQWPPAYTDHFYALCA